MNGNRRQWVLLGALLLAIFAYLRYGSGAVIPSSDPGGALAPIDADGLVRALKGVSTVDPSLMIGQASDTDPDRNLFQFGVYRPPPPPPMTEEQRLAAQAALRQQEKTAREAKETEMHIAQAQAAEAARRAAEVEQQQQIQAELARNRPPVPEVQARPGKAPPPPINFKFMGVMGSEKRKLGVFLDGDKMLLAREGDVFDTKFKVLDISVEWADVGYADPDYHDQRKRIYFGQ